VKFKVVNNYSNGKIKDMHRVVLMGHVERASAIIAKNW